MSDAQRALIINSLLASFEYVLEVGEDEVCQELIESKIDCSAFKRVTQRVAREIKLYFYYKQLLYSKGMELISVSEDFGEMGAFKGILEAFVMFAAEQERMNIAKRTSGGRLVKAAKGGYAGGRAPYGYEVRDKRLVIVPQEAEVVRQIFDMKKNGAKYREIVDALNAEGKKNKSGGAFSISTIQVILGNEKLYRGFYRYGKNKDWVIGQHEPILRGD